MKKTLRESFVDQLQDIKTDQAATTSSKLKSKLLLKLVSSDNNSKPLSMHTSHYSHGDWNRHWASGAFSTPIKAEKE